MCVWIVDADRIDFNKDISKYVFLTPKVEEFLNESQLGICANKGVGKTFLLKYKRSIYQKKGILCLPNNQMVDCPIDIDISHNLRNYFNDYHNWKRLWELAIFISIAMNYEEFDFNYTEFASGNIMKQILYSDSLLAANFSVSSLLQYLLHMSNKDVAKLLDETGRYLTLLQQVRSGIAIFLDKIDQALSRELDDDNDKVYAGNRNPIRWKYSQVALVEASYSIYNINKHIKVYFGIRPECFKDVTYQNDTIRQAKGQVTFLTYTKDECNQLFETYIQKEEEKELVNPYSDNIIERLLGFSVLEHSYRIPTTNEKVFDYIYRHSFGTPRDLMIIGNEIYIHRNSFKLHSNCTNLLKKIVNDLSKQIINYYVGELVHLSNLSDYEFKTMAKQFNYNIFNYSYLNIIFKNYVKEYNSNPESETKITIEDAHKTFIKFLSLGLVGSSLKLQNGKLVMHFESIQKETTNVIEMPNAKFLFLHPCLTDLTRELRKDNNLNFDVCNKVIIGPSYEFKNSQKATIDNSIRAYKKKLPKLKLFISSTCYDLGPVRSILRRELSKNFQLIMSDCNDTEFINKNGMLTHDVCVKAVEEADAVIFILDSRYGSEYSGNLYNYLVDEIKDKVKNIDLVSISLVEIYQAIKLGKKCFIYMNRNIENERMIYLSQENKENYHPTNVDKIDALFAIDLLQDNWINFYSTLDVKLIKNNAESYFESQTY